MQIRKTRFTRTNAKEPAAYLFPALCVWWSYALVHQSLLYPEIDPHNHLQAIVWFVKSLLFGSLPASLLLTGLCAFQGRKAVRTVWLFCLSAGMTAYFVFLLSISIYFRYFGDLPYPQMLMERWQETWAIRHQIIRQLLGWRELVLLTLFAIASMAMRIKIRIKSQVSRSVVSLLLLLSLTANISFVVYKGFSGNLKEDLQFGHINVAQARGIGIAYALIVYDACMAKLNTIAVQPPYPGKINPVPDKSATMHLPDKTNIILLQIESLDNSLIDYEVKGSPITPFLKQLKNKSIYFSNFIAQHSGGGTSDCEISVLASILPSRKGGGFRTLRYERIATLLQTLKTHGYTSAAFHPNFAAYYHRSIGFPRLGFNYFFHESHFNGNAKGMFAKDASFLEQSVEKLNGLPQPFLAHFITLQSHGPFNNITDTAYRQWLRHRQPNAEDILIDYLTVMHEVDQALAQFFNRLQRFSWFEHCLIVLFSDHLSNVLDHKIIYERIPLLLFHPHLAAIEVTALGSHIDIAPTIITLLDLPEPDGWLGTTLLPPDPNRFVLINGPVRIYQNHENPSATLKTVQTPQDLPFFEYSDYLLGR